MKKTISQKTESTTMATQPLTHEAIRSLSAEEIQSVIGGCPGSGSGDGTGGGNRDGSGPGNGQGR